MTLLISSPAFENNSSIPSTYTCDGLNVSPPLEFSGAPENSKSLALVVLDTDAVTGRWIHWLVWNIDPTTTEVPENSKPLGSISGQNDFKDLGWGGPCPPTGNHEYTFVLYALDTVLELESGATFEQLEDAMLGHVIEKAEYSGFYSRT